MNRALYGDEHRRQDVKQDVPVQYFIISLEAPGASLLNSGGETKHCTVCKISHISWKIGNWKSQSLSSGHDDKCTGQLGSRRKLTPGSIRT